MGRVLPGGGLRYPVRHLVSGMGCSAVAQTVPSGLRASKAVQKACQQVGKIEGMDEEAKHKEETTLNRVDEVKELAKNGGEIASGDNLGAIRGEKEKGVLVAGLFGEREDLGRGGCWNKEEGPKKCSRTLCEDYK